ncbi:hypothetical protein ACHAPG_010811 [Botrytis cinerea]
MALEVYKLLTFALECTIAITYFDYDVDILYLGVENISSCRLLLVERLQNAIKRGDLELVQHIAVDNGLSSQLFWIRLRPFMDQSSKDSCPHLSSLFPALHSLTSVVIPSASEPLSYQPRFENYSKDIIFATDDQSGKEFRPWMVKNNGNLLPWTVLYFDDNTCLFWTTEELRRLLYLRENDQNLYRTLGSFLARSFYCEKSLERLTKIDPKAFVDPVTTYRWTRYCNCQFEHYNRWPTLWSSYRLDRFFCIDEGFDIEEEMWKIHIFE